MAGLGRGITWAYNGYCVGGETGAGSQTSRQQINSHDWGFSYTSRSSFSSDFVVVNCGNSSKNAELTAIKALEHPNCNLGVTIGSRLNVTDGVISSTTLTSATGGFAATDVGLPVNVVGKGTAQITAYTDTNTVTISAAIGNGTALDVTVGYEILRLVPSTYTGGFNVRASVEMPDSKYNTGVSWLVRFTATWEQEADQARGANATGRREGRVRVEYDRSGFAHFTFSGVYTALVTGTKKARTAFADNFDGWKTAIIETLFSITSGTYEEDLGQSVEEWDDQHGLCSFRKVYHQLPRPQISGASWDDANQAKVRFSCERIGEWAHGRSGYIAPVHVSVSWDTYVPKAQKAYNEIVAYYTGTVKPYLIGQVTTLMSGDRAVCTSERAPILVSDDVGNRLIGRMTFLVIGLGNNLMRWNKSCVYRAPKNEAYRKVWDGKPDTYVYSSPGYTNFCAVSVSGSWLGGSAPGESALRPDRNKPPFSFAASGGRWREIDPGLSETKYELGRDIDGAGNTVTVVKFTWTAVFMWVGSGSVEAPRWIPGRAPTHGVRGGRTR